LFNIYYKSDRFTLSIETEFRAGAIALQAKDICSDKIIYTLSSDVPLDSTLSA
jgi:hypothetical protein